jgi:hypothetical protein
VFGYFIAHTAINWPITPYTIQEQSIGDLKRTAERVQSENELLRAQLQQNTAVLSEMNDKYARLAARFDYYIRVYSTSTLLCILSLSSTFSTYHGQTSNATFVE